MIYLYLSLGAIAGAISRYEIDRWFSPMTTQGFPWHTFAINISGSFLIGLLAPVLTDQRELRILLMTGFCGAYTTFSAYSLEIVRSMQAGRIGMSLSYLALSALLAPLACFVGYTITSR